MTIPKDGLLYQKATEEADKVYKKASAYKSGFIVKRYKELYLEKYGNDKAYKGRKTKEGLTRWYKENWINIGGDYPTYRPTVKVSEKTPKTVNEIPKERQKEQINLKQKIKGSKNLPPF